jgi:hypothetical protein
VKARTLIFSQRNSFKARYRCPHYEFENTIAEIDSVDFLAPHFDVKSRRYKLATRIAFHIPDSLLSPVKNPVDVKADYDLFFMICGDPADLVMLKSVQHWRERCKTAVCLIDELWIKGFHGFRNYLTTLKRFDAVVLYYSNTVKPLSERIERKCVFVPPAVDAIRFCPYPLEPKRVLDVLSFGRRSEVTHQKLLSMVEEVGLFYLYDTASGHDTIDPSEHRSSIANVSKRARYCIVNPALIDAPEIRGNQMEIGNRYFEGSAAGAILLGERPDSEVFAQLFDWPDCLIHLPYNSANIDRLIHELDEQPERQENIQRTNVTQALLRHDWAYRWESILQAVGLEPLPQLANRKQRLRDLATVVMESGLSDRCIPACVG